MDLSSLSNPSSCGSTAGKEKTKRTKGVAAVKLSTDPQSVAARQRRHRISDRFKVLRSLVPGGSKMDTVSMLEEAIQYVKFLKTQIWLHQAIINLNENATHDDAVLPFCYDVGGHVPGEVGLEESWFSGEEIINGGFDAFPWGL